MIHSVQRSVAGHVLNSFLVAVCVMAVSFNWVSAQSEMGEETEKPEIGGQLRELPKAMRSVSEDIARCAGYYNPDSVRIALTPQLPQTIPGVAMMFHGKIKNENAFPIVDGRMYAKVFHTAGGEGQSTEKNNGYALVDFFLAQDKVNLLAHEERDISFSWNVPNRADGGVYKIVPYFTSAEQYELLGEAYEGTVEDSVASFIVLNENAERPVVFDAMSIRLNDVMYDPTAPPVHIGKDEQVVISAIVTNPGNKDKAVAITLMPYANNQILGKSLIELGRGEQYAISAILAPGETRTISYVVPGTSISASTEVVGRVVDGDAQSIFNVHFVRDDIKDSRLLLSGIAEYPLKEGQENTLFACVRFGTVSQRFEPMIFSLTLTNDKGEVLAEQTYQATGTGGTLPITKSFVSHKDSSNLVLTARISYGGQGVEEIVQHYTCEALNQNLCEKNEITNGTGASNTSFDFFSMHVIIPLFIVSIVLFAISVGLYMRERKQKGKGNETNNIHFTNSIFLVLSVCAGLFGFGTPTYAVTWGSSAWESMDPIPRAICYTSGACTYDSLEDGYFFYANVTDLDTDVDPSTSYPESFMYKEVECPAGSVTTGVRFFVWTTRMNNEHLDLNCTQMTDVELGAPSDWIEAPNAWDTIWVYTEPKKAECPEGEVVVNARVYSSSPIVDDEHVDVQCAPITTSGVTIDTASAEWLYAPNAWDILWGEYKTIDCPSDMVSIGLGMNVKSEDLDEENVKILCAPISSSVVPVGAEAPVITPQPFTGNTSVSYQFTFQASDPEGDSIRYAIDWNDDGSVDEYAPPSGYIAPDTAQVASNPVSLWTTQGVHNFKVRTEDETGSISSWTEGSATISDGGPFVTIVASESTPELGSDVTLMWTIDGETTSCTAWGDWAPDSWTLINENEAVVNAGWSAYWRRYSMQCEGPGGLGNIASVTILPEAAPAPLSCPFASQANRTIVQFENSEVLWHWGDTETPHQVVSLGAGTYAVSVASWDGYGSRPSSPPSEQQYEQIQIVFGNAGGDIAWSSPTTDLEDGTIEASYVGETDSALVLSESMTYVYGAHAFPYAEGSNSLLPICVAFDKDVPDQDCQATTQDNCVLQLSSAGETSGACANGYSGTCTYQCDSGGTGNWSETDNLCVAFPVITEFKICDPGETNCVFAGDIKNVNIGAPIEIYWDSQNADTCNAVTPTDFSTGGAVSGNVDGQARTEANNNEDYTIVCENSVGMSSPASITLQTGEVPSLSANSYFVDRNDEIQLSWDTNNGDETLCSLTGGSLTGHDPLPAEGDPESGSTSVVIRGQTTFTLTCGSAVSSRMIEIRPAIWEF